MPINDRFMLPKRVRTMAQMADLLAAEQAELTRTQRVIETLEGELTISTSTALLPRHERILGLPVNTAENLEIRRARLLSQLNTHDVVSCLFIKTLAETFIDGAALVEERYAENAFVVTMRVTAVPEQEAISALRQQIEAVKPAHLTAGLLIRFQREAEHCLYTGFAVRTGRHVSVECEIPAELDVAYLTDENGDILTDGAGNRIID